MATNLLILFLFCFVSFWIYKNIKNQGFIWIAKGSLQLGILIFFVGSFIKLFIGLPSIPYIKIIFCLIYLWCTVGINVNFMIPLIDLIDQRINKNR